MKTFTEERFKHVVSVIIAAFVLTMMPTVAQGDSPSKGVQSETTERYCYKIPHTREEIINVQENGGAALIKLTNDIKKIIPKEELSRIIGTIEATYNEKEKGRVCFNIKKEAPKPKQKHPLLTEHRLA